MKSLLALSRLESAIHTLLALLLLALFTIPLVAYLLVLSLLILLNMIGILLSSMGSKLIELWITLGGNGVLRVRRLSKSPLMNTLTFLLLHKSMSIRL